MKRIFCLITILSILFAMAGCASESKDIPAAMPEEKDVTKIGMIFDNFVVERWQRDRDVFVSAAQELGADVDVQNANGDVDEQLSQMEYFIEKGVDVIVVVPISADSLKETVEKAHEAGISVISYDRLALNANVDLYISFDNERVGELMGEAIQDQLSSGDQVVMVCGSADDNNVSYIRDAFVSKMEEKAITVVDIAYMDNWKAELASDYVSNNLETIKQVQGIMCGNDDLAREVVRILAEQRLAGQICIVGQDADLEACQRIVVGTQYMTVYKPIEKLAKSAAEAAVALARGEIVETNSTISDNSHDIPFLKLEPLAVTAENMNAFIIDSGFHLKEDVYIDRPNVQ